MDASQGGADGYGTLVDRAYRLLHAAGGHLDETKLAAGVFGAEAGGVLWLRLLNRVLDQDPRFVRLTDGRWALEKQPWDHAPLADLELVVLELKATGPKPWVHRVIDLAALRASSSGHNQSYATAVNPQQRIPKYVLKLTGIRPEDIAAAPLFGEIAEELLAFLGSGLLVGHGLAVQIASFQYELRRLGMAGLSNPLLDTLDLAALLLPDLAKPSLANLAQRLGEPTPTRRSALADAHTVLKLALRLLSLAGEQGYVTLSDLRQAIERQSPFSVFTEASGVTRPRLLLDSHRGQELPTAPGVYALKGGQGQVLYVGKALNLKQRLSAYFNRPLSYTRQMEGLLEAVQSVEALSLDTELEALLLEAKLIRQHQPPYNVQRRTRPAPLFLRIDPAEPFPRLQARGQVQIDEALYFGPFRSSASLRRFLALVLGLLPLRTCRRALGRPKSARHSLVPCARLGAGACCGPCTGAVTADEYQELVAQAVALLSGRVEGVQARLRAQLHSAVRSGDTSRQQSLRESIRSLNGFRTDWFALGTDAIPTLAFENNDPLSPVRQPGLWEESGEGQKPRSAMVGACRTADGRGWTLLALAEGMLLGKWRTDHPLDPDELQSFLLATLAAPTAAHEEAIEGFNLAIRWLARHAEEAVMLPVQRPFEAERVYSAASTLAALANRRWREPRPQDEQTEQ